MSSPAAIQARELLEHAFPGRVTTPDSEEKFESERERPWSQSCWLPAAAHSGDMSDQAITGGSAIEQAHEELLQAVEKIARDKDLHLDFICPSFAGASQNVLRGFGQKNLQDLKDVAVKYDPEGIFQKQQSGGFLLRDV